MFVYAERENKKPAKGAVPKKDVRKQEGMSNKTGLPDYRKTQYESLSGVSFGAGLKQSNPVMQLRSENPYKHGGGITSHHIIPHELIISLQNKLDPFRKKKVAAEALPDFGNMNIKKLMVGAVDVRKDGNPLSEEELVGELSKNFGMMNLETKNSLTFHLGGTVYNYTTFSTNYDQYRTDPDSSSDFSLNELGQCFFEWQGGNLFQGPTRAEAMPSNQFDVDAHYFYGQDHQDQLKVLYDQLKSENEKEQPDHATIVNLLKQMTDITRNMVPPDYQPEKYIVIKNAEHLGMLKPYMEIGRQRNMAVGKSVPKEKVNQFELEYTDISVKNAWDTYYTYHVVNGNDGEITPSFSIKQLTIKVERKFDDGQPKIKVKFGDNWKEILRENVSDNNLGFFAELKNYIHGLNQHPQ